jgi:hypothetical protein
MSYTTEQKEILAKLLADSERFAAELVAHKTACEAVKKIDPDPKRDEHLANLTKTQEAVAAKIMRIKELLS